MNLAANLVGSDTRLGLRGKALVEIDLRTAA